MDVAKAALRTGHLLETGISEQIIPLLPQELVVLAKLGAYPPQFERSLDPDHELGRLDRLRQKVIAAGTESAVERYSRHVAR